MVLLSNPASHICRYRMLHNHVLSWADPIAPSAGGPAYRQASQYHDLELLTVWLMGIIFLASIIHVDYRDGLTIRRRLRTYVLGCPQK
jgi:hypothetical protein